jgi:NAD(P)-dependent dehydrogenase (short-subunit alcohol dehydrogenase family)
MVDLFSIAGKVALVTGGAQGLGRMIAEGLLRAGGTVYVTSRKLEACETAAAEMSTLGHCVGIQCDLSTPAAAVELARKIAGREKALHILVNNAGKTWAAPLESFPDNAWAPIMAINVQIPFTLIRELLPLLVAAGSSEDPARIINVGSVAGMAVERLNAYSYSASKAAIQHLTRVLAADLADRHIAVNAIVPGYFPTRMTAHIRADANEAEVLRHRIPLNRLGKPDDIAGGCIFLCSRAGAYVTGSEIAVDGGLVGCG